MIVKVSQMFAIANHPKLGQHEKVSWVSDFADFRPPTAAGKH
jgi:hypothetical protein